MEQCNLYGYCPICNSPGVSRERRPDGNDTCERGHSYPSTSALTAKANAWIIEVNAPSDVESVDDYLQRHAVLDGMGNMDGYFVPLSIARIAVENTLKGKLNPLPKESQV